MTLSLAFAGPVGCSDGAIGDSEAESAGSDATSASTSASTASSTGASSTGASASASDASTSGSASASTDASAGETTSTGSTSSGEGPSFTEVYEAIILPQGCNAGYCHGGGAGGLTMTDEATSYANLVEVDATAPLCGATVRVVPGSPDESILWYRARPAALDGGIEPCAPKMPQGSEGLSDADGQLLKAWIAAGALD